MALPLTQIAELPAAANTATPSQSIPALMATAPPETAKALLHKAHLDRPKDRADLAAARLDPEGRAWLSQTLEMLGHHSWAQLVQG